MSRFTPSPAPADCPVLHAPAATASTGLCINISSMSITSSSSSSLSSTHVNNDHCSHTSSSPSSESALSVVTISAQQQQQDCHSSGVSLLKPMATNSVKLKAVSGGLSTTNTLAAGSPLTPAATVPSSTPSASRSKSGRKASTGSALSNQQKEKLLPCKDRQYDPDKHCGVQTDSMDKACTRSLTCKTHSLTARRQVTSRSKPFDDLLEEHRVAKEEALRLAGKEVKLTKKQIRQREQDAKKAQKQDGKQSITSPGSSCRPSPASSPSLSAPSRHLSSSSQPLPSPGAPAAASQSTSSAQSAACIAKLSLQSNLTARIKRKEKEELDQQQYQLQQQLNSDLRVKVESELPPPPPLTPIRDNGTFPLILRPAEKQTRFEGPDGIHYISHPPRPLAVNTYNTRFRNLTNSRSMDPFSISSSLYSRSVDPTYAALGKLFQLNSQENSVSITMNTSSSSSVPQQSTSKSKKKKSSANISTSNNNSVTGLKQKSGGTSGSIQSSDLDASGNSPLVTNCLTSGKKSTVVSSTGTTTKSSTDQTSSSRKRPAAVAAVAAKTSYPTLKSMLDARLSPTSCLSLVPGSTSPGQSVSGTHVNGLLLSELTAVSPVTKRLRTTQLSPSSSASAAPSTYGLSSSGLSLESLLDRDIGMGKSGIRSVANETADTHSMLSPQERAIH